MKKIYIEIKVDKDEIDKGIGPEKLIESLYDCFNRAGLVCEGMQMSDHSQHLTDADLVDMKKEYDKNYCKKCDGRADFRFDDGTAGCNECFHIDR